MSGALPDAWDTAAAIRDGSVSAVSVVSATLDRIATDRTNAFTLLTPDAALAAAEEVDAGSRTGPLAGVPISVKDHVWVEGLPATNGSRALAGFVAPRSAVCVSRLVEAGAIIVGKTNNPEFCYRGITDSARARSRTDPASGPVTDSVGHPRKPGIFGTRPNVGLSP